MLYTIAKCDQCKESMLQVDFEKPTETLLDLLEAVKAESWKVDTFPGPKYVLRCQNCQNISHEQYTKGIAEGHDGNTKIR